jgi:hypothetical protein
MEYQIRVDYACSEIRTNGRWFSVTEKNPPLPGTINPRFLPPHRCRKDEYQECCENDPDCSKEIILEVVPQKHSIEIILDESGFSSGFGL